MFRTLQSRVQQNRISRRELIEIGAGSSMAALAGSLLTGCAAETSSEKPSSSAQTPVPGGMAVIDYGLSFLSGKAVWNRVRFWVESRTRIIDDRTGKFQDYYQCGSCKSEHTFAKKDLFVEDNYDFIPIFGPVDGLIFRRKAYLNPNYREWKPANAMWEGQQYQLRQPRSSRLLATGAEIHKATQDGAPLVAQTEISDQASGLRAIIEFPVKTINIRDEEPAYQVDTGPIAFPDLSKRYEKTAESLSLAFVAFNAPDFADFVIEDETPILEKGQPVTRVYHYSRKLSLPARNRLFATSSN
ncbi:MAG: hypothetical protein FJW26_21045 [Acidimicrobiia bacterium]|nr:hypothetical protein [Acidimicrobiia bacterium]